MYVTGFCFVLDYVPEKKKTVRNLTMNVRSFLPVRIQIRNSHVP
jgi:hypothetical protein